jgi:hypothetical protein
VRSSTLCARPRSSSRAGDDQAARLSWIQATSTGGVHACLCRVAGCATPSGSAGHAGATANLKLTFHKLTFHLDHSAGADHGSKLIVVPDKSTPSAADIQRRVADFLIQQRFTVAAIKRAMDSRCLARAPGSAGPSYSTLIRAWGRDASTQRVADQSFVGFRGRFTRSSQRG